MIPQTESTRATTTRLAVVLSYFGTYRYDRADLAGSLMGGREHPSYLGTEQVRNFEISSDAMTISGSYKTADGRNARFRSRALHRVH